MVMDDDRPGKLLMMRYLKTNTLAILLAGLPVLGSITLSAIR